MDFAARIRGARRRLSYRLRAFRENIPEISTLEFSDEWRKLEGHPGISTYGCNAPEWTHQSATLLWVTFAAGTSFPRHFHKDHRERMHLLEGDMTIEINGRDTRLKPTEGITAYPRDIHAVTAHTDSILAVSFQPQLDTGVE